jgi:hypothetical protein
VGAVLMAILVGLGLVHASRTPAEQEIFVKAAKRTTEPEPVVPVV